MSFAESYCTACVVKLSVIVANVEALAEHAEGKTVFVNYHSNCLFQLF